MKNQQDIMVRGPLLRNIINYSIPIMLTGLLQMLFNAADIVVLGRYCGSVYVAAVGACSALINLIVNLFIGLSVGAGVSVAHALGARDDEAVHRTVHTAMPAAVVSGLILTAVGICFSEQFLTMMGTPESVLSLSAFYTKIYFAGVTFVFVYNFAAAILRAGGDTRSPLIFLSIAGVINVVLNVFFVTVMDLNVAGVALATTISQGVSAVLVVIALMRRTDACQFILSRMHFYKPQLLKIIRIGLPSGLQSCLFAISNVLIQSSINSFGEILMSGNASSANIEGFLWVVLNSFHQTAVNFIGQNVGARQHKRALKTLWICLACVTVVGLVIASAAYIFGHQLLSIYITDSEEAIRYGMIRLLYVGLPYLICGAMDVSTGALRGLGASTTPMIISVLGVCGIRIGWIYTIFQIPQYHTPQSLYISYPISWLITFLFQMTAFVIVFRRHVKRVPEAELAE